MMIGFCPTVLSGYLPFVGVATSTIIAQLGLGQATNTHTEPENEKRDSTKKGSFVCLSSN
jgi:hypothetical protein